jgi:hypothetical protein
MIPPTVGPTTCGTGGEALERVKVCYEDFAKRTIIHLAIPLSWNLVPPDR